MNFFKKSAKGITIEEISSFLKDVKKHVDQRIQSTVVLEKPFPHIVVDQIFTDELYKKIDDLWPASGEFSGSPRGSIYVTNGCIEETNLSTQQKVFWRLFGEVIVNKYIKPQLIKKLLPYIHLKPQLKNLAVEEIDLVRDFINFRQDSIVQDRNDFKIGLHCDQLNLLAALLFYLPQDSKHQEFGTIFWEGEASNDPGYAFKEKIPDNFKKTKIVPYKPNSLVCFLQTPFSWHSVEPISDTKPYTRRMYVSPIFFSPEFMEKHYEGVYPRSSSLDYLFDNRFLCKKNWPNIWAKKDAYK